MRLGRQEPTFERIGDYAYSRGGEAVAMFESYGRAYYGSQKHEMEIFFARTEDGSFAAKDIGITKPRQNGKSFAARDYCIWMAFVEGLTVLFSMHNGGVARKMFREVKNFVKSHSDFNDLVDNICESRGYEGIYLKNGAYIEFQTRSSGVRGGTYRILLIDEAQELTSEQSNSLIPTASAAAELTESNAEPQKIYIGTVPDVTCRGTVFRSMHDRVHDGESGAWWMEWGVQADSLDKIDLDDIDNWYACNPAMGRRMSESTVRSERDTMTPDGFARERLGWWPPSNRIENGFFNEASWDSLAISAESTPKEGTPSFAIKFAPDGMSGCVAACRKHDDGRYHVEVVTVRSLADGLSFFIDFALRREGSAGGFAIDGGGPANIVYEQLLKHDVPKAMLRKVNAYEFAAACSMLADCVLMKSMTHIAQPGLDDSVKFVRKRQVGKSGFGFEGIGEHSELPTETIALAMWAAEYIDWEPDDDLQIG